MSAEAERSYDTVIVGGSFAGLQAAVTLGRARRRVLVVDDGNPRNAPALHVNNFLGLDAPAPADLNREARRLAQQHDVTFVSDRATQAVRRADGAWVVRGGAGGSWAARSVLLATGLADELPRVAGIRDLWGTSVVACPHCHGWEVRDQPLAQIGVPGAIARTVARALLLSRWSADVVLLTQAEQVSPEQIARLSAAGVVVEPRVVVGVARVGDSVRVDLADGGALVRRALFVAPAQRQQSELGAQVGCRVRSDDAATVEVDDRGRTGVAGIWAAGTTANPALLGIAAAGHGATVAVDIHATLLEEDLGSAD